VSWSSFVLVVLGGYTSPQEEFQQFLRGVAGAKLKLKTAIELLEERLQDVSPSGPLRALRAHEGLEHPQIEEAASALYRDGHYERARVHRVHQLAGEAIGQRKEGAEAYGAMIGDSPSADRPRAAAEADAYSWKPRGRQATERSRPHGPMPRCVPGPPPGAPP
jgi:hypothetical protein